MARKTSSILSVMLVGGIAALVVIGLWHARGLVKVRYEPPLIMGTHCDLTVVAARERQQAARKALEAAEQRIRQIESLMSVHLADSQLSEFNAAAAGAPFPLAPELLEVLRAARDVNRASDGAFDVTVGPLVKLWQRAGRERKRPSDRELAATLRVVGMDHLRFDAEGVTKLADGVSVDLGGIAKGYAVDQALAEIRRAGFSGIIVNIGGDLRCSGSDPGGRKWRVGIRHPFAPATGRLCGKLALNDAAVATSGDYFRFVEIDGQQYSHILDPRTGWPVERRPSVTVVSLPAEGKEPSAMTADAWATALSVLGPPGLELLAQHPGLEAMIVVGTQQRHVVHTTSGFEALLAPGSTIDLD